MSDLTQMRKSIDNIDNAIVAMLAERFKITEQVGHYKADLQLPAQDTDREAQQYQRIEQLAEQYGLDKAFARALLQTIIKQVVANHRQIAAKSSS